MKNEKRKGKMKNEQNDKMDEKHFASQEQHASSHHNEGDNKS